MDIPGGHVRAGFPDDRRLPLCTRADLRWLSKFFPTVMVVLSNSGLSSLWVRTVDLEGRLTLQASYHLLNKPALIVKRAVDLILGTALAVGSAPFLLIIALLIRLDSPGPVVYAQERVGLQGEAMTAYRQIVAARFATLSEIGELKVVEANFGIAVSPPAAPADRPSCTPGRSGCRWEGYSRNRDRPDRAAISRRRCHR